MKKTQRSFNSTIRKSGRPKKTNPARRRKNYARAYGGKKRRDFVASLPCAACHIWGFSVNAHLLGNGGMSRKKDATSVGPLCERWNIWGGCHPMYDNYRTDFDRKYPGFDPEKVAAQTEAAWRASLGSSPGGET